MSSLHSAYADVVLLNITDLVDVDVLPSLR
jgi:hypothetical protein